MGFIRFFLAFLVLAGHSGIYAQNIGPLMAVQLFFVLSGVYMAAVYTTKYSRLEGGVGLFYLNRGLRLWPTYLLVLAATAIAAMTVGRSLPDDYHVFSLFYTHPGADRLFYVIPANLLMFGQDVLSLDEPTHYLLPIRQGWSLATELLFYLVVPFIYGRRFGLLAAPVLVVACFGLKFYELNAMSWRESYFFPLGNFGYFLFGCFLYHLAETKALARVRSRVGRLPRALGFVAFVALAFSFPAIHFETHLYLQHFGFLLVFGMLIVLSFEESTHRLDIYLGNISYGIYLNHLLIVVLLTAYIPITQHVPFVIATFVLSVLASMATESLLQRPVDRIRARLTRRRGSREPARRGDDATLPATP